MNHPKIAALKTAGAFRERTAAMGLDLPCDDAVIAAPDGPLAQPCPGDGRTIGNRFAILPMEGWDAEPDGRPSALTHRRWQRFGLSGAKLIWGGEAVAVRHDGRANPRQLLIDRPDAGGALAALRRDLVDAHERAVGSARDLVVGLQLTHSGRYSRPNRHDRPEPRILYRHPLLDNRVGVASDDAIFSDGEIDGLIGDFVRAARLAREAGFDFIDLKHCHGYLGHEFLSAVHRPGRYGGPLENRTRFLRDTVAAVRQEAPGLGIGLRLSVFDQLPWQRGPDGAGQPCAWRGPYPYAFGARAGNPHEIDWDEPLTLLRQLPAIGIRMVCLTAGSPYANPHLQRPAAHPPSDGYAPPEDPLVGVARQISAVAHAKAGAPDLLFVGSAYSYLQEWLGPVAQAQVRLNRVDVVGIGRMVLSYPEMPADLLAGRPVRRKAVCRTFSECTTGPRLGLVSGCFPLDPFFSNHPAAAQIKARQSSKRPESS